MNKALSRLVLMVAILIAATSLPAAESNTTFLVDCELHYLNFNQSGDGMEKLFKEMDRIGIKTAWLMGIPLQKVWGEHTPMRPAAYESDAGWVYCYSTTDVILARDIIGGKRKFNIPVQPRLGTGLTFCGSQQM